jgi:hypothetical protein
MPSIESILRNVAGLTPTQQRELIQGLRASADHDDGEPATRPRSSEIFAALKALPNLDAATRSEIVRHLVRVGHVFDDGLDEVHAAAVDERNISLHRQIQAEAKRLGYDYKIGVPVDSFALDHALAGKDIEQRFRLKAMMAQVGVLR